MKKKTEKNEDPLAPGHHVALYYGYDVRPDGKIEIASAVYDEMDSLLAREAGIRKYMDAANEHLIAEFKKLAESQQAWWDRLKKQYPFVDYEKDDYSYTRGGIVEKKPKPPKAPTTEDAK